MEINYHFLERVTLPQRRNLKFFITQIFKTEKKKVDYLNIIFCDDDYLLAINQNFLGHNDYTDIISFRLNNVKDPLQGELYISVSRIRENSKVFKTLINKELHRVIFHGILHFCGYNDKTKKDIGLIRNRENFYLDKYFVPRETLFDGST